MSESTRDYILQNYPQTDPAIVRVVPRGVDPAEYHRLFRPSAEWLKRWQTEHPGLKERFVLTLPARLTRLKGHEDFVSILASLREAGVPIHGLVVGGTHPRKRKYADCIRGLAKSAGLGNHLSFLGQRADLREIMSVSDVVLSLSGKPESFGRSTLEALALGRPVAAYSHGGVAEQLRHFLPQGAIEPGDPEAASALLASWFHHGAPTPAEHNPFTLQATLAATLAVYRELVE